MLRYFKPQVPGNTRPPAVLAATAVADREIELLRLTPGKEGAKRSPYYRYMDEERAPIRKFAAENGIAAAAIRFTKLSKATKPLNESTVRGFKKYEEALRLRKRSLSCDELESDPDAHLVNVLPAKKRGRPLLLGEEIDCQVQSYLRALRAEGGVVNTAIARAAVRGIVMSLNRSLLTVNGGSVELGKEWARSLHRCMGFVKRKASTKSKMTVEHFEKKKEQFLEDIASIVTMEEIPSALIVNWDQTGINIVPSSSWTMEVRGAKRVEIGGLDDKRQITGIYAASLAGDFLPIQLIYQGKTNACHPSFQFPPDWDITHSPNHWSNEVLMEQYLNNIIIPYVEKKRQELELATTFQH